MMQLMKCKLYRNIFLTFMVSLCNILVDGAIHNSCFLNDGQCSYHVRVVSSCKGNISGNTQQDGYHMNGPNAIEKYLLQVKSEHSKRLSQLEGKLKSYSETASGPVLASKRKTELKSLENVTKVRSLTKDGDAKTQEVPSKTKRRKRLHTSIGFKKDPSRKENHLLNRIHREFSTLRDELASMKSKLSMTEKMLHESRTRLNESEADNRKLSHRLRDTEGKLEEEQANNFRLSKASEERQAELNHTKSELHETQTGLRQMKLDNWKLKAASDNCRKALDQCLREKDILKKALERALIRYHDLNLRHENVTLLLNRTQEQLIICYKGKTTQFCGFEGPLVCGFESGDGDLDWIRWKKGTPSAYTGPSRDHTCDNNKGHYMYVEATKRAEGETATLVSPRYYGYGKQCIEFFYHMYGYHVGTLKVYTRVPAQEAVPMWRAMGNQGDVWSMARIPVPRGEAIRGYQVVFEVTIGFGNEGDVAIDDIRVFDGGCYVTSDTSGGQNTTANGKQVNTGVLANEQKEGVT